MMMHEHINRAMLAAQQADSNVMTVRVGVVTAYNPADYSARVRLMPEGVETGSLPVATMRAGKGWGLYLPPSLGDVVLVLFQESSIDAGIVMGMMFGDRFRPANVPAGEFLLRHESGSRLQFRNDGTVHLQAVGTLTSSAPAWNHTGPMNVDGSVTVTGAVAAGQQVQAPTIAAASSLTIAGKELAGHVHSGGDNGSNTGAPV